MSLNIEVQIAGPDQAEIIADMSRRTFYDSFAADNTEENMNLFLERQFDRQSLIDELSQPGNTFLLASLDGKPAGYCRLQENTHPPELGDAPSIEIVRLYAEKAAIGHGIGKALMQTALDIAGGLEKEWIWLGVWEHNHRALKFYEKWGFERFGQHIFMVGDDPQTDWYMKRRL